MSRTAALRSRLRPLKAWGRNAYWTVVGSWIRNPPPATRPRTLIFICKGNICRSPFAERLAARLGGPHGEVCCLSAGLEVARPLPPPAEAVAAGSRFGIDLAGHRSRRVTPEALDASDMVIAMEAGQFARLRRLFPRIRHKIYLLPLFEPAADGAAGGYLRYNIPDPYGRPVEEFLACYRRIERCLGGVLPPAG